MNLDFLDKGLCDEDDLYAILGCDETSSIEQIRTEYRQRVRTVHPDKADPGDETASQNYERYRWAYDILSNEDSRVKYDTWKRSDLLIPFKAWLSMTEENRRAMHWALQPKKKLMITDKNESLIDDVNEREDTRNCENNYRNSRRILKRPLKSWGSSLLSRKFMNYEI